MIFIDANVWLYATGGPHQLRDRARAILRTATAGGMPIVTSSEVVQELLHVCLRRDLLNRFDVVHDLIRRRATIISLDAEDVAMARDLVVRHAGLSARDLVHLATCLRRDITELATFDRALAAAFDS